MSKHAARAPISDRPRPEDLIPLDSRTFVASDVAPLYVVDPDQLDPFPSARALAYDLIELVAVAAFVTGALLVAYALAGA
jgi:hypothetical protein